MADAAKLFDATLKEEKATDMKLTDLAESEINVEAEEAEAAPAKRALSKAGFTPNRSTKSPLIEGFSASASALSLCQTCGSSAAGTSLAPAGYVSWSRSHQRR
jgi:hypothetical protein